MVGCPVRIASDMRALAFGRLVGRLALPIAARRDGDADNLPDSIIRLALNLRAGCRGQTLWVADRLTRVGGVLAVCFGAVGASARRRME
jgi:hypothetical protein